MDFELNGLESDEELGVQCVLLEEVEQRKAKNVDANAKASDLQVMINKTYSVGAELNNMRKNSELCDVIIRIGDVDFQVHRIVLSAVSSYFKTLLLGDFTESKEKVVEIKEIEADIMEIIINYAYTSELSVTESTAMALFVASDRFQVSYIRDEVGRYLEEHVCESNCIELFCLSDLYNCLHLKEKGKKSFADIYRQENFLNLTCEMLAELTSSDDLMVDKEETVCEAVFLWYQFNPEERKNDFEKVFETIRLALLDSYYLVNIVQKFPDINRLEFEKSRKLIRDVELFLLMPHISSNLPKNQYKYRKMVFNQMEQSIHKNLRILVNPKNDKNILCYDSITESWSSVAIPASEGYPIRLLSLTLVDSSNLYAFHASCMRRYCLKTNKWDLPCDIKYSDKYSRAMIQRIEDNYDDGISSMRTLAHEGEIYIIYYLSNKNGSGNDLRISVYNPEDCTISSTSFSYSTNYRGHTACNACVLDSYIYIVGVNEREAVRYCINTDKQELINPMIIARHLPGMAAKDGKLFVRGGGTDSVEVYDPHRKCWSFYELDYKDKWPFVVPYEIQRKYK